MSLKRIQYEDIEKANLASYAMKSKETKGRDAKDDEHELRTCFSRDRDRIVHCGAFRRLEYKTQVFVVHEGDYYRTRLTHTMEVSQIARTLARNLRLNEDLTEAIALAHDLGHTPFGHSGEEKLDQLMKAHGQKGFEHNSQSLRIVTLLEERYPGFTGLNLTYEVREGIDKHRTDFDKPASGNSQPTLEAQVVNLADEIAYNSHDLDDGIKANLVEVDKLKDLAICVEIYKKGSAMDKSSLRYHIVRNIIDVLSKDLIQQTETNIAEHKIKTVEDVRRLKTPAVAFSTETVKKKNELKAFLTQNLYKHYRVIRMEVKHQRILEELFNTYLGRFDENREKGIYSILPPEVLEKHHKLNTTKEQAVCDYIASMTDNFALMEHKRLFDPMEKV